MVTAVTVSNFEHLCLYFLATYISFSVNSLLTSLHVDFSLLIYRRSLCIGDMVFNFGFGKLLLKADQLMPVMANAHVSLAGGSPQGLRPHARRCRCEELCRWVSGSRPVDFALIWWVRSGGRKGLPRGTEVPGEEAVPSVDGYCSSCPREFRPCSPGAWPSPAAAGISSLQ